MDSTDRRREPNVGSPSGAERRKPNKNNVVGSLEIVVEIGRSPRGGVITRRKRWPRTWSTGLPACRSAPAPRRFPCAWSSGHAAGRHSPPFCIVAGVAVVASGLAIRGLIALTKESDRRHQAETQLAQSRDRKGRMEVDQYFHQILAAEQALASHDPDQAERLLNHCPPEFRNWEWRHLRRRLHPELSVLQGRSGFLCADDFQPTSSPRTSPVDRLAGSIWHTPPAASSQRLYGPDGTAYGLAFDRSGTRLATAGPDGIVKVWNVVTGEMTQLFHAHRGWAAGVAFRPDGAQLASTGEDGMVRLWDLGPKDGGEHDRAWKTLAGHVGPAFGVAYSPDGTKLASAGSDGTVRIWELAGTDPAQPSSFVGTTRT